MVTREKDIGVQIGALQNSKQPTKYLAEAKASYKQLAKVKRSVYMQQLKAYSSSLKIAQKNKAIEQERAVLQKKLNKIQAAKNKAAYGC